MIWIDQNVVSRKIHWHAITYLCFYNIAKKEPYANFKYALFNIDVILHVCGFDET